MEPIKILPETLKKFGFVYKLVERSEHKCIYAQTIGEKIFCYEVFSTKIRRNRFSNNELYESFPGHEEFGKRAWSFPNLESALKKYHGI